jgi:3-isopropylmalate dehydrogenase
MVATVAVLRGDGIGPEVTEAALSVLGACIPFKVKEGKVGGVAIDATGDPLPQETLELCRASDAVFLGAVGGPRWDDGPVRAEDGLFRLRRGLGLYANIRPARYIGLPTPLREGLARHADILVVRELSSGVYFGEPRGQTATAAFNTWRQSSDEVRRVAHVAFRAARRRRSRVTSVDKANVLEVSRLWRSVVTEVSREYSDVELEHRHADAASFEVLQAPHRFDVILTDNLFGDILSGELAAVVGSIGLLPSTSFGDGPPLYEPVHGSAPGLAGRGIANPTGAILTASMLLEHSLGRPDLAKVVEAAVVATLREVRTPDIGGTATAGEFTAMVHRNLSWLRWAHSSDEQEEKTPSYGWGV